MDTLCVYITCKNSEEAQNIAATVIEEGVAACANIFSSHESIYMWEGKICHANEVAMLLKTPKACYADLQKRVQELHSYEEPCIVAWKIDEGSQSYLQWVQKNTK